MLEMKIPLPITRIFNHLVARGPRYGDELFIKKKKIGKIRPSGLPGSNLRTLSVVQQYKDNTQFELNAILLFSPYLSYSTSLLFG